MGRRLRTRVSEVKRSETEHCLNVFAFDFMAAKVLDIASWTVVPSEVIDHEFLTPPNHRCTLRLS